MDDITAAVTRKGFKALLHVFKGVLESNSSELVTLVPSNLKERLNGGGPIICPGHRMIPPPACVHLSHLWEFLTPESVARQKCFLLYIFWWGGRGRGGHPGAVSLPYLIQCVTRR